MPIHEAEVNQEFRMAYDYAFALGAQERRSSDGSDPAAPIGEPPPPAQPLGHQPIYTAGLRALSQRRVSATHSGWNFLSRTDAGAVGGDVPYVKPAPNLTSSRSEGQAVDAAARALRDVETYPDIERSRQSFERRLLRIPGLLIEAFWLKAPPYDDLFSAYDFVCPFHTYDRRLARKRIYTMSEFLDIVQPLALRRLGQRTPE